MDGSAKRPAKLRLLALHSFRTSAKIFQAQFNRARLGQQTRDLVEVVFIDAPHPASGPIPKDVSPFFEGPYYEWFTVEAMGDKFYFDEAKLARSTEYVAKFIREQGPFDGLVGFSQGSVMSSSIIAMQRAGVILADVLPLKLCILFAGMKSRHPEHQACMQTKVKAPSLHIYGDRDEIREHCVELAEAFEDAIVVTHTRGHSIPAFNNQQVAVLRGFLSSFLEGQGAEVPPRSKL